MQSSQLPTKIQLPFGKNAGGAYIRTIPVPSQIGITNGEASFNDGFPPLCFLPDAGGGINPDGRDFNGILNALSALLWWYSAGAPVSYDSTFQTAIGGYPKGAILQSAVTSGLSFISTTENNATNPDTGGAGWLVYPSLGIPQNVQSVNYTTVMLDGNRSIHHPAADNNPRTYTIDSNADVPYPVGTTITFTNEINVVTIAITSDTLVWSPSGALGSRSLAANGIATAVKITTTKWFITGTGLS